MEKLVFSALLLSFSQICYYKTQDNKELDFLVLGDRGKQQLIQVCETLADPKTRKRELDVLFEAMRKLRVDKGLS